MMIKNIFGQRIVGVNRIALTLGVHPTDVIELTTHYGLELVKVRGQLTATRRALKKWRCENQAALNEIKKTDYQARDMIELPKPKLTRWEK